MKKRPILLLVMGALLLSPVLHAGFAQNQAAYSESLRVYVAGQNALWLMSFSGVNVTDASLTGIEGQSGLNSYSISAIKFGAASSDFQVFGTDGYGLVGLPFIPQEGLFLTIGSSNQSLVDSLVSKFDVYLQAALVPISTSGTNHTYFSPASFDRTAAPKLFKFAPISAKGFASLFSEPQFTALPTPMISLEGARSASGFRHTLTIGSAIASVTDSAGRLVFANLLRLSTNSTLAASPLSNRTEVYVRKLDGFVVSGDQATVVNNQLNFSGSYSRSFKAGQGVKPNISAISDAPVVIGTRVLDRGSVSNGDFLSVTLQVQNLGSRESVKNLTVDDGWWKAYPQLFQVTRGNSSFKVDSLAPGQNYSSTYVLKTIGSNRSDIILPALWGSYAYGGTQSFGSHVLFNQAEVRVNDVGPAITVDARASVRSGSPLGTDGKFVISVKNLGNGPALNLRVLNDSQSSLAQNGGTLRFNFSIPMSSLSETNVTRVFSASWQTPSGANEQIESNRVTALFSHNGMRIPYIKVTASSNYVLGGSSPAANLTYSFQNLGRANSSSVTGEQSLPDGIACEGASTSKGSCTGAGMAVKMGALGKSPTEVTFRTTLKRSSDFVVMPLNITTWYLGIKLHTYSSSALVPGGFSVRKSYTPGALFGGMRTLVVVTTSNAGPMNLYNVTFSSPADSFDTIVGQQGREGLYQLLQSNHSVSFNYTATLSTAGTGTKMPEPINASFVFAGTPSHYLFTQASVSVYDPLTFSATTFPAAPIEARPFSVAFAITNAAPVAVSQVRLQVPLPSGLQLLNSTAGAQLSNGVLLVSTPELGANSSYRATLSFKAAGGMLIDLTKANLTFSFMGTTVRGHASTLTLTVNEDVTSRYTEPIVLAVLIMLAVVVIIRRRVPSTSPSSPKETPQTRA